MSDDGNREPVLERRLDTQAHDPRACSEARQVLVEYLKAWQCDHIDDVALVFSEMVTNAVLHAGGAQRISACPADDNHHVHLEVQDNLVATPEPCVGGPGGGFGLHIIEHLSDRWGTTPTADGKVVWAFVPSHCGGDVRRAT